MKTRKDMFALARRGTARVGAATAVAGRTSSLSRTSRQDLLESSQRAALGDARFREHVERGDRARDLRNWFEAEAAYAAALDLYPYERSYWTQLGHMAKEQESFVRAENAYRTACALGAAPQDVDPHLRFVMARQGLEEHRYPILHYKAGPQRGHVPGRPDVLACARLLWGALGMDDDDIARFLRGCATLDELMAAMIRDPRFERANRPWLELVREEEL
jgi:tetratricopeptide (TPR) repeat protein